MKVRKNDPPGTNGYEKREKRLVEYNPTISLKDIINIILIIVAGGIFIWRGESHMANEDIHNNIADRALLNDIKLKGFTFSQQEKTDFKVWQKGIDTWRENEKTRVKEIVRETIRELKQEGYIDGIKR